MSKEAARNSWGILNAILGHKYEISSESSKHWLKHNW